MSNNLIRSRNAMIGLAIGNAVSWTAMYQRSLLLPQWTRRIRREMEISSESNNVFLQPMPFSLNQNPDIFYLSPSCLTEWAVFTSEILLRCENVSFSKHLVEAWKDLAENEFPIRGSISIKAALKNIREGKTLAQCGKENPHYFDDAAMVRAVPIGVVFAGNKGKSSAIAEIESSVTNSEDGIWAAQALAVLITELCSGVIMTDAINSSCSLLPPNSWISRIVIEALELSKNKTSAFQILPALQKNILNREYSYGNAAPETFALAITIAKIHADNFEEAVAMASCLPKCGETLPALVGAIVGAHQKKEIADSEWLNAMRLLKGISIPGYAGKKYLDLVDKLLTIKGEKILV